MHRRNGGYTITELLVVVAILGALAVLVALRYGAFASSGNAAQCLDSIRGIRTQLRTYHTRNHSYPAAGDFSAFLDDTSYFTERPTCPDGGGYALGAPDSKGVPTVTCSVHGSP